MKRPAIGHTKMKKLCRRLGVKTYVAVGIMESLWHLTAREAPLGDIGKLSNEDIAAGIDYEDNPDHLIEVLIDCKWLDESPLHRITVHDWHEHADDAIRKSVQRAGKQFVSEKSGAVTAIEPTIYFVQSASSGCIKIGFTEGSVTHRLKAMQTGNPDSLKLLLTLPGTKKDELDLHKRFAALAANGDWFRDEAPLSDFVRQRLPVSAVGSLPEPEPEPVPVPVPVAVPVAAATNQQQQQPQPRRYEPFEEIDESELARRTVGELMGDHPMPGNPRMAEAALEKILANAVSPVSLVASVKRNHAASVKFWEEERALNPRFFIPPLHRWFNDGDYLHPPKARGPTPSFGSKTSYLERRLKEAEAKERG